MAARVSAIILNYNGVNFIEACLASVSAQDYPDLDIVVVDNASTDASSAMVRKVPAVRLIECAANLGFSGGMNKGIAATTGDYVLLLNPDVTLERDYVSQLVALLEKRPEAGAATGKTYRMGTAEPPVIDGTGHVIYKNRLLSDRGENRPDEGQYEFEEEVFGVCAGMSLYRRAMLEDVREGQEYFDESFFMFLEDVDLDWRARLRGWSSFYTPLALARHHRGGIAKRSTVLVEKHNYKNRYLVLLKNDSMLGGVLNVHHFLITDTLKTGKLLVRCPAALLGWLDVWRALPRTLAKRRQIQGRRKISPRQLEKKWFQPFDYKAWILKNMGS